MSAFQLWKERPDIAELVVFEPDGLNAGLLALNVWNWGDTPVRVMPVALGRTTGNIVLARNPSNTGDNRLWDKIPLSFARCGWWRSEGMGTAECRRRRTRRDWRGGLDLLLLDTQGWEPDVLAGARRVILEERPTIVFEWWPQALAARGFDSFEVLSWLERDLRLRLEVVPPTRPGFTRQCRRPQMYKSSRTNATAPRAP